MRYTKLTLEDLIEEVNNLDLDLQSRLLCLNDIGEILKECRVENATKEAQEEAKIAEAFFRNLLDSNTHEELRKFAIQYLLVPDSMEKETLDKLRAFPKESWENRRIYVEAGELMI